MDTGNAVAALVLWVVLGLMSLVPVVMLARDWAEGGVEGGYAVAGSVAIFTLLFASWRAQNSAWLPLFILLLLGACVALPLLRRRAEQQLLQEMDDEDMATYRAAIERDERNSGAHAGMGDCYFKRGDLQQALAHYDTALSLSPDPERNAHLAKWQRKRSEIARAADELAARATKQGRRVV